MPSARASFRIAAELESVGAVEGFEDLQESPMDCHSRHLAPQQETSLFDDLVGDLLKDQRHFYAKRLGSFEVD